MVRLQFDANQPHQLDAINAILGLFEGHARLDPQFALHIDDGIIANLPEDEDELDRDLMQTNLRTVQRQNRLDESFDVSRENVMTLADAGGQNVSFPSFTLEMETGTGKTYVYLRAIYALRQKFGLSKFVIVVPSVAIYEGVRNALAGTREHFKSVFDNEPLDLIEYDSNKLGELRGFAQNTHASVLLITLDSFNRPQNRIYRESDKLQGTQLKPFEFVQRTRPIVILDEPQNMSSDKAKQAIGSLHPLMTLRFSATHRESPNLIYRLSPADAFRLNLVKKIQVCGVTEEANANERTFELLRTYGTNADIRAEIRTQVIKGGAAELTEVTVRVGDDLFDKTKRPELQSVGYRVANIRSGEDGFVTFENGEMLGVRDLSGSSRTAIFRAQIAVTLEEHFKRQREVRDLGIKVLSLFFIDRVASYTAPDALIRRIFDEEFERIKDESAYFRHCSAADVRIAYFAKKKVSKISGEEIAIDETDGEFKKSEQAAYRLIMQAKGELLSFDTQPCFIFAHSALREGWDNPNVFQICTLRESASDIARRQALGRGLRLCVNQNGERIFDDSVNILTVIANESYKSFAQHLQQEYVADGDIAPPMPTQPHRNEARRNDQIYYNQFKYFWAKLSRQLNYHINIDTAQFVRECVDVVNRAEIEAPNIKIERGITKPNESSITIRSINKGKATIQFTLLDKNGEEEKIETTLREGESPYDVVRRHPDLKKLGPVKIVHAEGRNALQFSNEIGLLYENVPFYFSGQASTEVHESRRQTSRRRDPVFNVIERAANEIGITKGTLNAIFKNLRDDTKRKIFDNPEGFAKVFIEKVRETLAAHVSERIEFSSDGLTSYTDPDELFPPTTSYPQREISDAEPKGLYSHMPTESDVEKWFIGRLRAFNRVSFFFKFPPKFKIPLPKVVGGNYNPDWGIACFNEEGKSTIYLIRETKGNTDEAKLRFAHEKRKIECARRYFRELGIDYRVIDQKTSDWHQPDPAQNFSAIAQ